VQWLDQALIDRFGLAESIVHEVVEKGIRELQRREGICACGKDFSLAAGSTAVIVDDGISNSIHNVLAAVEFVRRQEPRQLLIAAPVISCGAIAGLVDECESLVYLYKPETYINTDYWYQQ
jgi:putative phosphoribosyl transferase